MRRVIKTYRFECDEGAEFADLGDQCDTVLDVTPGEVYLRGFPRPVETAEDANWVAKGEGWHYAGSKAYCPKHAGGRR